ncbi:hypothetical protein SCLCIDRAFT_805141 [Scleroderma citrinum Foug A]|uniref:DUF6533 domain-containing protein n=1 Tax=Scleroderma citrinum Foug A TaxID=1036808 RepID=A0A0C3AC70_9AGAM|nr:hypothetical protein SCLCIDRAFT_805141 [Scleroderma citrinum Foug A]
MEMDAHTFLHDLWLARVSVAAGYTLLWYDYFLTIGDEIEYIWNSPRTAVKFLYLLHRYGTLFGHTVVGIQETGLVSGSLHFCEGYAIWLGIYLVFSLEVAHNLVFLRAWVLWVGNGYMIRSLVVGYIVVLISVVAGITNSQGSLNVQPIAGICYRRVPGQSYKQYNSL